MYFEFIKTKYIENSCFNFLLNNHQEKRLTLIIFNYPQVVSASYYNILKCIGRKINKGNIHHFLGYSMFNIVFFRDINCRTTKCLMSVDVGHLILKKCEKEN